MLKQIISRSNGKGYEWLKKRLTYYIRGWITYYRLADMKSFITRTNQWYQRRLRMYIWKNWKKVKTRFVNLQKCGIKKYWAWQWANSRKGYWHVSNSRMLTRAITNENLARAGYPSIIELYSRLHRS